MTTLTWFGAKYLFLVAPWLVLAVLLASPSDQRRPLLARLALASVIAVLLAKTGGWLYDDPRPFVLNHSTPLVAHGADNGFPSDHALLTFMCAFLLWPFSRPAGMVIGVVAALVSAARVSTGLHHPVDVAGSVLVALLANAAAACLVRRRGPSP